MILKLKRFLYYFPKLIKTYDLIALSILKIIPVKFLVSFQFFFHHFKFPNLKNPITFNEKIQMMKIDSYKNENYKYMDKINAKKELSPLIGNDVFPKVFGIYNSTKDIKIIDLPNKFVIKTNHGSGFNIICQNKSIFDFKFAFAKINRWLNIDYGLYYGEKAYSLINPKILIEEFIEDKPGDSLIDYKIHCFNGVPKLIQVDVDRYSNHKRNFYDLKWNLLDLTIKYKKSKRKIGIPRNLDIMIQYSILISKIFKYVRIDMYNVKGKIYIGELTFFHGSGYESIFPKKYDNILGDWLKN